MMFRVIAHSMREHDFYLNVPREELFIPFENEPNIHRLNPDDNIDFDFGLTVTGSGFIIVSGLISVIYFIKEELERRRMLKGIKTAAVGCNIGPYEGILRKKLITWKLRSYDFISVRDMPSYEFVKNNAMGVQGFYCPDIVFSMPDEWIPNVECEGHLGISAYKNILSSNMHYYRTMAETADKFIEKTGKRVLLFAFDMEHENDLCAAHTILSIMKHADSAEIIAHAGNGDNIVYNLKRCSGVIGTRFHMSIMAIRLGIPLVSIAYSEKTVNALRGIGFTGKIFGIDDIDSEQLLEELDGAAAFDESFITRIKNEAGGHSECLKKIIK